MTMRTLWKIATATGLALSLAGCVDVAVDVALTSPTTAEATLTQTMVADFYAMKGMSEDPEQQSAADVFCQEGELTENADGSSATCIISEAGAFADLDLGQQEGGITFTNAGDGLVRIAMATEALSEEISGGEPLDAETASLAEAIFIGRTFILSFSGAEVTDTNMTLSDDGTSATQSIPIIDIIKGEVELPQEFYAVVRAP